MSTKLNLVIKCDHCGKTHTYPLGMPKITWHTRPNDFYANNSLEVSLDHQYLNVEEFGDIAHVFFNGKMYTLCENCYKLFNTVLQFADDVIDDIEDEISSDTNVPRNNHSIIKEAVYNSIEAFMFNEKED